MDSYVKSVGVTKKFKTCKSLLTRSFSIKAGRFLDRSLFFIKIIIEYALGIHLGYAIGWLIGLWIGHTYVKYFEPVYLEDLNQLAYWRLAPEIFAKNGAIIGIAVGVIAIAIINRRSLNQRIISLYENGCTNPDNIARRLGKSHGKIERKLNKLIKKKY